MLLHASTRTDDIGNPLGREQGRDIRGPFARGGRGGRALRRRGRSSGALNGMIQGGSGGGMRKEWEWERGQA